MGWWTTNRAGISFQTVAGEDYVTGDTPADIMGDAMAKIAAEYQREWGRPPKRGELRATLEFVLLGQADDTEYTDHL